MKKIILALTSILILILSGCGEGTSPIFPELEYGAATLDSKEDFYQSFNWNTYDGEERLLIPLGLEIVTLEYTGGLPVNTLDLNFPSDEDLKVNLTEGVNEFIDNIEDIRGNNGVVNLLQMEYNDFSGYYSLILGLLEPFYDGHKDSLLTIGYTPNSIFVITQKLCKNLNDDNVKLVFKPLSQGSGENILIFYGADQESNCPDVVTYNNIGDISTTADDVLYIQSAEDFKIYKYQPSLSVNADTVELYEVN